VSPRIIVEGQRRRPAGTVVLIAMVVVIAMPLLFGLARNVTLPDLTGAHERVVALEVERDQLKGRLREIQVREGELKRQLSYLTHGKEIDKQACADARRSLVVAQGEAAKLREQLGFYRGLVAPETVRAGMRVQDFRILPGSEPGAFRFEVVLIQPLRRERLVSGALEVNFVGRGENGIPLNYLLSERLKGQGRLLFSFKQFQEFSGEFTLPISFRPQRILVTLAPEGRDIPKIEEEFDWAQVQENRQ
jgi:hypothetical protein